MNRLYLFDLLRMQEFMEQNFRKPIDAEDIAQFVGYSSWHCRRIFEQYMNETLSNRLRRYRLEAAKQILRNGATEKETALSVGFTTREGFSKAFRSAYGISPGKYARGEESKERYRTSYEYHMTSNLWNLGNNPTSDRLWEFSYYDPNIKQIHRMNWNGEHFEAPYARADESDPAWYCRNRFLGYGMHPGKEVNAVKSFVCPEDGSLEYFISLGRMSALYEKNNPCTIRVFHEKTQIFPQTGPLVLHNRQPIFIQGVRQVSQGDRISICLDAMGHMGRDGVMIYRQHMGYLK